MFSAATKDSAQNTVQDVKSDLTTAANQAGRKVRNLYNSASDEISQASETVTKEIRTNPVRSSMIALGIGVVLGAEVNHFEVRIDLLQRTEGFLPSSGCPARKRRKAIVSTVLRSGERKRIKPRDLYLRGGYPLLGEHLIGGPIVRVARVSRVPADVRCVENFA